jgi:polyferredoxin
VIRFNPDRAKLAIAVAGAYVVLASLSSWWSGDLFTASDALKGFLSTLLFVYVATWFVDGGERTPDA